MKNMAITVEEGRRRGMDFELRQPHEDSAGREIYGRPRRSAVSPANAARAADGDALKGYQQLSNDMRSSGAIRVLQ